MLEDLWHNIPGSGKYGNPRIVAMSGSMDMDGDARLSGHISKVLSMPFAIRQVKEIPRELPADGDNNG
ncbi:MAG TPA: hypothetical protein DET40_04745 [Lentisphaeria bacterium]|nr:MAG: hypothetical protein A2X45_13320 [Lentisphaerae bacterium GWF2_50_93]HCE42833.1 hypothetical protein [Lentisphaeria bacterium]